MAQFTTRVRSNLEYLLHNLCGNDVALLRCCEYTVFPLSVRKKQGNREHSVSFYRITVEYVIIFVKWPLSVRLGVRRRRQRSPIFGI